MAVTANLRRVLGRGELVKLLYRLGRHGASGVVTITASGSPRHELFALRRGALVTAEGDHAQRTLIGRLVRLVALDSVALVFEGGVAAYPPGGYNQLPVASWARRHLEQQLDNALADQMTRELAGARMSIKADLAPDPADEADRRMLAALAQPRRIDQIWSLARTPRFRLLSFIHFLRAVDAVEITGVVVERSAPVRAIDPRREAARRMLGLDDGADLEAIKRAYRRLARELHPDLRPEADHAERRVLERRFAEVTAAYEALI